jgi:arginase
LAGPFDIRTAETWMTPTTFALLGLPTDRHSSYLRGPAKAPSFIRAALSSDSGSAVTESGYELGADLHITDLGDVPLREDDGDDTLIERAVAAAIRDRACPILLGGDHSVTYPIVRAIAGEYGPIDILHFDAHPDLYDSYQDNRRSHASPFARVMEERLARRLVQVGIRTLERQQRAQAERFGVEIIEMRTFEVGAVPILAGPMYVTIDLDGLDPAFAPGVAHYEPGGLSVREVLRCLHAQRAPLIGADIVELNPDRDVNDMTAIVAAKFIKELCSYGVAHAAR